MFSILSEEASADLEKAREILRDHLRIYAREPWPEIWIGDVIDSWPGGFTIEAGARGPDDPPHANAAWFCVDIEKGTAEMCSAS